MLQLRAIVLLCLALPAIGGCALHHNREHGCAPPTPPPYELPAIERGSISADVADAVDPNAARPRDHFVALTAAEAQCTAVMQSTIGNLLDREASMDCGGCRKRHDECDTQLRNLLLHTAAAEMRNKNAADALRLYYGIAEAEAGLDSVAASEPIVTEALAHIDELRRGMLTIPFDETLWDRQLVDLAAKRADLEATRADLNAKLRVLLNYPSQPDDAYFWPNEQFAIDAAPFDAEGEVGYGLATDPEIQMLRELPSYSVDSLTDVIKALLGQQHGLLGLKSKVAMAFLKKLLGCEEDCEPCARVGQLRELSASRENKLAGEIRAAVRICDERRREAALAEREVESWAGRVSVIEQKRAIGESSFVELAEAQLKLIEARQSVVSAVMKFKRAEVDLHELQGALVAECGCPGH